MQVQRLQNHAQQWSVRINPIPKKIALKITPHIVFGSKNKLDYAKEYGDWLKDEIYLTPADYDLMMLVRTMNNLETPVTPAMRKQRFRDPHDIFALWMTETDSTLFNANPYLQPQPNWVKLLQKAVPTQNNPMAQFFPGVVKFNNELRQLLVVAGSIPPIALKMAPKRYALNVHYQKMQKPDLDGRPFSELSPVEQAKQLEKGRKEAKTRLAGLRMAITKDWEDYQTRLDRTWDYKNKSISFNTMA